MKEGCKLPRGGRGRGMKEGCKLPREGGSGMGGAVSSPREGGVAWRAVSSPGEGGRGLGVCGKPLYFDILHFSKLDKIKL